MPVYFAQAGSGGPVKIGRSNNPVARIRKMKTDHHGEVRLLRLFEGGAVEERKLHARFVEHRIRGEWFEPDVLMSDIELPAIPIAPAPEGRRLKTSYSFSPAALARVRARRAALWADPEWRAKQMEQNKFRAPVIAAKAIVSELVTCLTRQSDDAALTDWQRWRGRILLRRLEAIQAKCPDLLERARVIVDRDGQMSSGGYLLKAVHDIRSIIEAA